MFWQNLEILWDKNRNVEIFLNISCLWKHNLVLWMWMWMHYGRRDQIGITEFNINSIEKSQITGDTAKSTFTLTPAATIRTAFCPLRTQNATRVSDLFWIPKCLHAAAPVTVFPSFLRQHWKYKSCFLSEIMRTKNIYLERLHTLGKTGRYPS